MNYLKIAFVALLVGLLVFVVADYSTLRNRNKQLNEKVAEQSELLEKATEKVALHEKAALEAEKRASKAAIVRERIITKYQDRFIEVTKQQPPTQCEEVIQWAIQQKSDLSWSAP